MRRIRHAQKDVPPEPPATHTRSHVADLSRSRTATAVGTDRRTNSAAQLSTSFRSPGLVRLRNLRLTVERVIEVTSGRVGDRILGVLRPLCRPVRITRR